MNQVIPSGGIETENRGTPFGTRRGHRRPSDNRARMIPSGPNVWGRLLDRDQHYDKMHALGVARIAEDSAKSGPDIFDKFFSDHSIDIQTGELLGRYIAEERDSGRRLRCARSKNCSGAVSPRPRRTAPHERRPPSTTELRGQHHLLLGSAELTDVLGDHGVGQ